MMTRLRSDVFGVAIEGDLVLLDLAADRYICLPGALDESASFQAENPTAWSPELSQRLKNAEVLDDDASSVDRSTPPLPKQSAPHVPPTGRIHLADYLYGLGAVHDVRRALRRPGLGILLSVTYGRSSGRPALREDILNAACQFSWLLPWLPIEGGMPRQIRPADAISGEARHEG